MNSVKKLALALLVVLASTFTANAQDARAKFTLTHEVRWENATLPAGNLHDFRLLAAQFRGRLSLRRSQGTFHHRGAHNRRLLQFLQEQLREPRPRWRGLERNLCLLQ